MQAGVVFVCILNFKFIFSAFFGAISYISSQLGEKYAYFLPIREKNMHFPSFFYPPSFIFSPTCYLAIFLPAPPPQPGGANRKLYTPACKSWPADFILLFREIYKLPQMHGENGSCGGGGDFTACFF